MVRGIDFSSLIISRLLTFCAFPLFHARQKLCPVYMTVHPLTVANTGYNLAKDVGNMYVAGYTASCKKIGGEVEVSVLMPKNIWQ